jgi:hypothetical protein
MLSRPQAQPHLRPLPAPPRKIHHQQAIAEGERAPTLKRAYHIMELPDLADRSFTNASFDAGAVNATTAAHRGQGVMSFPTGPGTFVAELRIQLAKPFFS